MYVRATSSVQMWVRALTPRPLAHYHSRTQDYALIAQLHYQDYLTNYQRM